MATDYVGYQILGEQGEQMFFSWQPVKQRWIELFDFEVVSTSALHKANCWWAPSIALLVDCPLLPFVSSHSHLDGLRNTNSIHLLHCLETGLVSHFGTNYHCISIEAVEQLAELLLLNVFFASFCWVGEQAEDGLVIISKEIREFLLLYGNSVEDQESMIGSTASQWIHCWQGLCYLQSPLLVVLGFVGDHCFINEAFWANLSHEPCAPLDQSLWPYLLPSLSCLV